MEASDYATTDSAASNGSGSESPWAGHEASASSTPAHPEIPVVGAFIGAFVFAKVLKKLGGDDD